MANLDKVYRVFRRIMNTAVKERLIPYNPVTPWMLRKGGNRIIST